jgi:ribosomal-protein-alanine N-acetyltransferase
LSSGAPELVIRKADPADLAVVLRIENRNFTDPWSADALYGELHTDHLRLPLVATSHGVVCGYLMAWVVADQLHILNIATAHTHLRQGVGTALLRRAAVLGQPRGVEEITLEVRESNTSARAFYTRLEFAEVGIRPGYYQDNGENAIIMTAPLNALLKE